jgi:hypothetical protein
LKIIKRENIDLVKWDALVKSNPKNGIFSLSSYLDAVSENWCVCVNSDYSSGIALPFVERLTIKTCYTPIFVRYLQWLGKEKLEEKSLLGLMKNEFQQGQFNCKENLSKGISDNLIFQTIEINQQPQFSSQAKRMFSKFRKSTMKIELANDESEVMARIYSELPQKVASLNDTSLAHLTELVSCMKKEKYLQTIVVKDNNTIVGGLFLLEFNDSLLYLKGAFTPESKKEGAMYAAMETAISLAKQKQLIFDFGGSRVEGVRRFNLNLGGIDNLYYSVDWNNAPFWFNWLKKIKQSWKRK